MDTLGDKTPPDCFPSAELIYRGHGCLLTVGPPPALYVSPTRLEVCDSQHTQFAQVLLLRSWPAGGGGEIPHTGSPRPEHKVAIERYHSPSLAIQRRRRQKTPSPIATADAMGSQSSVCVPASIPENRRRAMRPRTFPIAIVRIRRTGPLWFVGRLRLTPSSARTDAQVRHDGRTVCGWLLIPPQSRGPMIPQTGLAAV